MDLLSRFIVCNTCWPPCCGISCRAILVHGNCLIGASQWFFPLLIYLIFIVPYLNLSSLFLFFSQLTELALLYCQKIANSGLLGVGQSCKFLQALHLVDCSKIGDEAICGIAKGCTNLKKLHIRRCYEVSFFSISRPLLVWLHQSYISSLLQVTLFIYLFLFVLFLKIKRTLLFLVTWLDWV